MDGNQDGRKNSDCRNARSECQKDGVRELGCWSAVPTPYSGGGRTDAKGAARRSRRGHAVQKKLAASFLLVTFLCTVVGVAVPRLQSDPMWGAILLVCFDLAIGLGGAWLV